MSTTTIRDQPPPRRLPHELRFQQETLHHDGAAAAAAGYYDNNQPHPDGGGHWRHRHDDDGARQHQHHRHHRQQPPRYNNFRNHRSGVLEWTAAVVFTILAIVVLVAAVTVLVVVLLLQPRAPYLAIRQATLDTLQYDQSGALDAVEVALRVEAHNGNSRSAAVFSGLELRVAFAGDVFVKLRADHFALPPKGMLPPRCRGCRLMPRGARRWRRR